MSRNDDSQLEKELRALRPESERMPPAFKASLRRQLETNAMKNKKQMIGWWLTDKPLVAFALTALTIFAIFTFQWGQSDNNPQPASGISATRTTATPLPTPTPVADLPNPILTTAIPYSVSESEYRLLVMDQANGVPIVHTALQMPVSEMERILGEPVTEVWHYHADIQPSGFGESLTHSSFDPEVDSFFIPFSRRYETANQQITMSVVHPSPKAREVVIPLGATGSYMLANGKVARFSGGDVNQLSWVENAGTIIIVAGNASQETLAEVANFLMVQTNPDGGGAMMDDASHSFVPTPTQTPISTPAVISQDEDGNVVTQVEPVESTNLTIVSTSVEPNGTIYITENVPLQVTLDSVLRGDTEAIVHVQLAQEGRGIARGYVSGVVPGEGKMIIPLFWNEMPTTADLDKPVSLVVTMESTDPSVEQLLVMKMPAEYTWQLSDGISDTAGSADTAEIISITTEPVQITAGGQLQDAYEVTTVYAYTLSSYESGILNIVSKMNGNVGRTGIPVGRQGSYNNTDVSVSGTQFFDENGQLKAGNEISVELYGYDEVNDMYVNLVPGGLDVPEGMGAEATLVDYASIENVVYQPDTQMLDVVLSYSLVDVPRPAEILVTLTDDAGIILTEQRITTGEDPSWVTAQLPLALPLTKDLTVNASLLNGDDIAFESLPMPIRQDALQLSRQNELWLTDVTVSQNEIMAGSGVMVTFWVGYALGAEYQNGSIRMLAESADLYDSGSGGNVMVNAGIGVIPLHFFVRSETLDAGIRWQEIVDTVELTFGANGTTLNTLTITGE